MDRPAKLLVTGAGGQVGRALLAQAAARRIAAVGCGHAELPVEDSVRVAAAIAEHRPTVVVHCAAWTDVDGCEREPARADAINGGGAANVAAACAAAGASLVALSTDFVFDGRAEHPYRPGDPTGPLSAYGRSKLAGERAVLAFERPDFWVVRTSWVFGPGGRNFPAAILARARSGEPLRVVADQRGAPTYAPDLAAAILELIAVRPPGGVYHATNDGDCTWHELAQAVLAAAGLGVVEVAAISSTDLDRPAPRPAYSVLDVSGLVGALGAPLPHYLDAVRRYVAEEQP